MNNHSDVLHKIAGKLYELFVVNRNAMSIQLPDGNYVTKYTKLSDNDIFCMLKEGKSIGTYQQLYRSPYLKWICFDFDCKNKEEPNLDKLFIDCVLPLNIFLNNNDIFFINEFSGRRGIHTWILFNDYVSKQDAYLLLQTIKKRACCNYDKNEYELDEFPSTPNSKGNTVGKQVKLPLSKHKKGYYSYLFFDKYRKEEVDEFFWEKQLSILSRVKLNDFPKIAEKLYITDCHVSTKFVRTYMIGGVNCNADDVIHTLSKTKVYSLLLDRVINGSALSKDWLVMLGTLGKIGDDCSLLKEIFKYCPSFSEEETSEKIEKYGRKYFPATFGYLYNLYHLEIEADLDPSETGLQFLLNNLGIEANILEWKQNEKSSLDDSRFTVEKEKNYLLSNDEVPVVTIFEDLNHMTKYDTNQINQAIEQIKEGKEINIVPKDYYIFERIESKDKRRKMVSLSAYDRVLSTHIALNLFYRLNQSLNSFSYNPNYISSDEIFFHWFSSWGNYLSQIRKYIEVDLYSSMHVLTIDIKHFYDTIDFLGVYKLIKDRLSIEANNLFMFLIKFNEKLMRNINSVRIGVPQGPAYARIIAELFLDALIKKALPCLEGKEKKIYLYRYVDDIIVFYDENESGEFIFNNIERVFERHGLRINNDKSKIYGAISDLTDTQKDELLRKDQFQYGLHGSEYSFLTETEYVKDKINSLIKQKGGFNVSDLSVFFSKKNDELVKRIYFSKYASKIFNCYEGRGSGYQLFYRFVFETPDILEYCLEKGVLYQVPYNSINFSCLLATTFYSIKSDKLSLLLKKAVIDNFVKKICLEKVLSNEDKSIIISLSKLNYEHNLTY